MEIHGKRAVITACGDQAARARVWEALLQQSWPRSRVSSMAEKALTAVIREAYIQDGSTRSVGWA
jgi:hypothetical protein